MCWPGFRGRASAARVAALLEPQGLVRRCRAINPFDDFGRLQPVVAGHPGGRPSPIAATNSWGHGQVRVRAPEQPRSRDAFGAVRTAVNGCKDAVSETQHRQPTRFHDYPVTLDNPIELCVYLHDLA